MKKKGILIGVIALAVALVSVISIAISGSDIMSKLVDGMARPLKSVVSSFVGGLEHLYGYMYEYDSIVEENNELKRQLAQIQDEYREYDEIIEENERLRALFKFSEDHAGFQYEQAVIISWSSSNWSSSFTIGKGTNAGLSLNDCVITEYGHLVGHITDISDTSATVTTILDTTSSLGVLIYRSSDTAVLEGDFSLMRDNLVRLAYYPDDLALSIGDTIVTSGMGDIFPQNLIVGYVSETVRDISGLNDYAIVQPAADFENMTHVYVIKTTDDADS